MVYFLGFCLVCDVVIVSSFKRRVSNRMVLVWASKLALGFVWVVYIYFISVWVIELGLISVKGS